MDPHKFANYFSRINDNDDWMLNPAVFHELTSCEALIPLIGLLIYITDNWKDLTLAKDRSSRYIHLSQTVAIKFTRAGSQEWWCLFIPFLSC